MTYLKLAIVFLSVAAAAGVVLPLVRRDRALTPRHWVAVTLTAVGLLALTAVFDTLMIASGLFYYDTETLTGLHVGLAPIEDFAYPLATAALLPGLWVALGARHDRDREG